MPNPSIKDEKMYRDLRKQGNSEEKAARISNAAAARGKSAVGRKGGKSGSYQDWTVPELKKRAERPNTYPHLFINEISRRFANSNRDTIALIYTDGFAEGTTKQDEAKLQKTIQRLAANPRLRYLAFIGADPKTVIGLRKQFAPLKERFVIYTQARYFDFGAALRTLKLRR